MTSSILLTGGTGTLGPPRRPAAARGRLHVRVLSRTSHRPRTASSTSPPTWPPATGSTQAVAGARTILHLAGSTKGDEIKARNLVRAASRRRTHLVYISVVGADRVPVVSGIDRAMFGYYAAKRGAEIVVVGVRAAVDDAAGRPSSTS